MAGADSAESPLEAVMKVTGDEVAEAFKALGNETRLAILVALWDAQESVPPGREGFEPTVSFSELRERVGTRDSGQFNYHLEKLLGSFIEQTEDGYSLTETAEQVLHAVFAGTLRDHAAFEGEPVDAECLRCGEPIVIDYSDGVLVERCTSCEGIFQAGDHPRGLQAKGYRPPAGLRNRTPAEFHRHGNTWERHQYQSIMEGVCPDCTGSVTTTIIVCEDHKADDETVCEACGSWLEYQALFVCDICKFTLVTPAFAPLFTEMAVKAFFYERGHDIEAGYDRSDEKVVFDAIEEVEVTAEDPLELTVVIELAEDRLEATLDDDARVIDVTEEG